SDSAALLRTVRRRVATDRRDEPSSRLVLARVVACCLAITGQNKWIGATLPKNLRRSGRQDEVDHAGPEQRRQQRHGHQHERRAEPVPPWRGGRQAELRW